MSNPQTLDALKTAFPTLEFSEFRGEDRAITPVDLLFDVLKTLKESLGFDFLVDITCVDYLYYHDSTSDRSAHEENSTLAYKKQPEKKIYHLVKDRFGLVYLLANTETNERITIRAFVSDPEPTVPSAVPLWEGANWLEREVWDMFGIRFTGHPDLRRILLPEEFTAFPLRKDYPLQGRGERHNFPVITRVESG